jgi:hypothetical protein
MRRRIACNSCSCRADELIVDGALHYDLGSPISEGRQGLIGLEIKIGAGFRGNLRVSESLTPGLSLGFPHAFHDIERHRVSDALELGLKGPLNRHHFLTMLEDHI